ncbi:PQQ-binding-like beta-propeller repeat protein [Nocardia sp. NPDC058176]|uniref:outer membrane protein assembly factor BamB family protein n=1 Tax=Nocardia sp. NPDC058176 TaxID=3346368 RepID=UPI0036DC2519
MARDTAREYQGAKLRRLATAGVVVAALSVSACATEQQGHPTPVPSSSSAPTTTTTPVNRPAVWSIDFDLGAAEVAVVGDVVITPRKSSFIAVDRASGRERWRRDQKITNGVGFEYRISGELVVLSERRAASSDPTLFEVIEVATGRTRWQASANYLNVYGDAVYQTQCTAMGTSDVQCTTMRHDIADGKATWPRPADGTLGDDKIGTWHQQAPPESEHLPIWVGSSPAGPEDRPWASVATATGHVLPGRSANHAWYAFSVGELLINTDHDRNEDRCEIALEAINGSTGTRQWSASVHGGRRKENNECQKRLSGSELTPVIGTGSRIAAVTADGTPQLFDLTTGSTVWTASDRGTPLDGDERSLLVSEFADQGALSLLDLETGKTKWSVPDPGFAPYPSDRTTFLVGDRVVVGGPIRTGEYAGRPTTIIYDRETGREIDRHVGWLQGAGADWLALAVSTGSGPDELQFHR